MSACSLITVGVVQVCVIVIIIDTSEWIRVVVVFIPHFIILCAIQGIRNAALMKGLLDQLDSDVLPGLNNPLADLIQFHFSNVATGGERVLISQHPILPLLPHSILKRFVDRNI